MTPYRHDHLPEPPASDRDRGDDRLISAILLLAGLAPVIGVVIGGAAFGGGVTVALVLVVAGLAGVLRRP